MKTTKVQLSVEQECVARSDLSVPVHHSISDFVCSQRNFPQRRYDACLISKSACRLVPCSQCRTSPTGVYNTERLENFSLQHAEQKKKRIFLASAHQSCRTLINRFNLQSVRSKYTTTFERFSSIFAISQQKNAKRLSYSCYLMAAASKAG